MEIQKIISNLQKAKELIGESAELISHLEVSKNVGEKWVLTEEFEQSVYEMNQVGQAIKEITNDGVNKGKFDLLMDKAKELAKDFFTRQWKQKIYEGSKIVAGYRVVNRKDIKGNPAPQFVIIEKKPNTKAIDEYIKATTTDQNPDGKLPDGIVTNSFEYVTFKNIQNEED